MNVIEFLRTQAEASQDWLESVVVDVSTEQANWRPPGIANTIAATYAHTVINCDVDLNRHLLGRTPLVDREWGSDPGLGRKYSDFLEWAGLEVDWPVLRRYGEAVRGVVVDVVGTLSAEDLARRVDWSGYGLGVWTGLEVVDLTVCRHVYMHGGEIACLKGLQGSRGYTQGLDAPRPLSQ
jgi:hypothetical protein